MNTLNYKLLHTLSKVFSLSLLLLLLATGISIGQHKIIKSDAVPQKADSCELTVYKMITKEMTKPGQAEVEEKLKSLMLSYPDMTSLEKKLSKKPSYTKSRALLTHYNLVFKFYKKGQLDTQVTISTITGNVNIDNLTNKSRLYRRASSSFGAYLLWLLDKNKVLHLIPPSNLEGLTVEEKAYRKN